MELTDWLVFSSAVFIGSYIQSIAGFAMGMILISVCGANGAIALPELTATVSLVSFANIVVALRGHLRSIERRLLSWLALGQLPAVAAGFLLMGILDRNAQWLLQLLLGLFITAGSLSMMFRPAPLATLSPRWACLVAGMSGGVFGGMFSASGPIIGWFAYRQPLELSVIRATLLAFFGIATLVRSSIVALHGGLTSHVFELVGLALPLVVLGSWLGQKAPPRVTDATLKRMVFTLLLLMGLYITLNANSLISVINNQTTIDATTPQSVTPRH
jgi:uncharacterized membrane protein YfcA